MIWIVFFRISPVFIFGMIIVAIVIGKSFIETVSWILHVIPYFVGLYIWLAVVYSVYKKIIDKIDTFEESRSYSGLLKFLLNINLIILGSSSIMLLVIENISLSSFVMKLIVFGIGLLIAVVMQTLFEKVYDIINDRFARYKLYTVIAIIIKQAMELGILSAGLNYIYGK